MRFVIGIEYLGADYSGWQKQHHSRSVQAEIERALSKIANVQIELQCAGRTDAGVHATGQVAHFDTDVIRSTQSWLRGSNANLPKSIKITWIQTVSQDFHARFSAVSRHYQYILFNRQFSSAILNYLTTWEYHKLDVEAMNKAANYLLGEQNFSCFRSSQCQSNSPMRNITKAKFTINHCYIIFDIIGNAFLHHMVRNIVGSLLEIGQHKVPPNHIQYLIEHKDRSLSGKTAPAEGLYLVGVKYPDKFNIPKAMKISEMLGNIALM